MEDKIYKRQVTKEGLAARVVDRQQIHRTMSKEEVLHLFDFGEDEIAEMVPDRGKENDTVSDQKKMNKEGTLKSNPLPLPIGTSLPDKVMENLLNRHHPRWIASYHEHETLLRENEEEKLSKEEQDLAWESFRQTVECGEVQRISLDEPSTSDRRPVTPSESAVPPVKSGSRPRSVLRRCTNLAHLLTLRNKNIKVGCSIVCMDCAMEISWENLNRDGRSR